MGHDFHGSFELLEDRCNIPVIAEGGVSNKERSSGEVPPHNHCEVDRLLVCYLEKDGCSFTIAKNIPVSPLFNNQALEKGYRW